MHTAPATAHRAGAVESLRTPVQIHRIRCMRTMHAWVPCNPSWLPCNPSQPGRDVGGREKRHGGFWLGPGGSAAPTLWRHSPLVVTGRWCSITSPTPSSPLHDDACGSLMPNTCVCHRMRALVWFCSRCLSTLPPHFSLWQVPLYPYLASRAASRCVHVLAYGRDRAPLAVDNPHAHPPFRTPTPFSACPPKPHRPDASRPFACSPLGAHVRL